MYIDRKTKPIFQAGVDSKSDLEAEISTSKAHMEVCAKDSCEYDGKHRIEVGCFVSDRDANLTSKRAVRVLKEKMVGHIMAPADARNALPLLDNISRRLRDMARSFLDHAKAPIFFNEMSFRWSGTVINFTPQPDHPLRHSAMRQWEGKPQDLTQIPMLVRWTGIS